MPQKFLLIGHAEDETDDRASHWLQTKGYQTDWVFPYLDQPVPTLGDDYAGVFIYGGRFDAHPRESSPFLNDECRAIEQAFKKDLPLIGTCLGAQLMADVLGVHPGAHPDGWAEYGYYPLSVPQSQTDIIPDGLMVLESHWHGWFDLPQGCTHLAGSDHYPQQAFRYGRNAYAFQFHPEASKSMIERWISRRGSRGEKPGAHSPERQMADYLKYDAALENWFFDFLDNALKPAVAHHAAE